MRFEKAAPVFLLLMHKEQHLLVASGIVLSSHIYFFGKDKDKDKDKDKQYLRIRESVQVTKSNVFKEGEVITFEPTERDVVYQFYMATGNFSKDNMSKDFLDSKFIIFENRENRIPKDHQYMENEMASLLSRL